MIVNRSSSIALAVAALLCTASAHAQSAPGSAPANASGCVAEGRQPPCLSIASTPPLATPADGRSATASGTFMLFGNVKGLALSQTDIARTMASFGSTWRLKGGISVEGPGGVEFTASTIARRGYSLPVAMVQPLGSDVQSTEQGNASLQSRVAPIHWDTELRIRKALLASDTLDVDLVGEAFNLLNLNRGAEPAATTPILTSPTVRAGVLLGF